jgi:hypothetical protein
MRHEGLEEALNLLAKRVIETNKGHVDVELGPVLKPEGIQMSSIRRCECLTFARWAYEEELSEEDLCANLYVCIIHRLPKEPFTLYWRVKPQYERDQDFYTGKWRHRVVLRIAWHTEDFGEHS